MAQQLELPQRLGTGSATIPLALGGMLGAGLFAGIAAASSAAGVWLFLGIPIAAATAACCAMAAADQSDVYRGPGAVYACARSRLGVVPGRIAASTNLVGHLAGMAAIAGVIKNYLGLVSSAPVAILLVVLASTAGIRIRGRAAWWSLGITASVVVVLVLACFAIAPAPPAGSALPQVSNPLGITGAAGVLFFGFAGFERVAAPASERERFTRRSIRRGIAVSLSAAGLAYFLVAGGFLYQLGPARLALSPAPAIDALGAAGAASLKPLVLAGALLVLMPVLLAALESFRSTGLAVVEDGDLPGVLGRTTTRGNPYLLDLAGGLGAAGLSVLLDPAQAIALSACCLLVYYAFGNAGARLLLAEDRTWPMRTACLGMGLSVVLAMSMPVPAMVTTLAVAVIGPVLAGLHSRRWS